MHRATGTHTVRQHGGMLAAGGAGFVCLIGCVLTGCATDSPTPPSVFSDEWVRQHEAEQKSTPNKNEEVVLFGKKGGARAYVYKDEKGNPQFAVGGRGRLSADVDIKGGDPEVKVKYKIDFGRKKRRMPAVEEPPAQAESDTTRELKTEKKAQD